MKFQDATEFEGVNEVDVNEVVYHEDEQENNLDDTLKLEYTTVEINNEYDDDQKDDINAVK